jgi:Rap guanine nucleotide exchange factor 2
MLSLQEFGISECSSNFTLTELTVEGGFMKQKRLPNDQTNLAERIGLASRYYIKNVMSSEQLIADESELAKESQVNLLQLNAVEIAMQIMVEDFKVFRMIGEWTACEADKFTKAD